MHQNRIERIEITPPARVGSKFEMTLPAECDILLVAKVSDNGVWKLDVTHTVPSIPGADPVHIIRTFFIAKAGDKLTDPCQFVAAINDPTSPVVDARFLFEYMGHHV